MAILRIEILSGGGLLLFLLLVLMSPTFEKGAASFRTTTQTWWNLGDLAQNTTLFTVAAAAVGAWYGSRSGRMRTRELVERPGRGWRAPVTSDLLLTGGMVLIVQISGYLVTAGFMARNTYQGPFPWAALLIGNLFSICFLLFGYVFGSIVRTWFAPLLASVVVWPALVTMGFEPQLDALNPGRFADRIYGMVGLHEPDSMLATYVAWTLICLAGTLFLLIGMAQRSQARVAIAMVGTIIGTGVFANLTIQRDSDVSREGLHFYDVIPVCESGEIVIYCVNPVNKASIDEATSALDRIAVQVYGVANLAPAYFSFGLNENSRPANAVFFADQGDPGITAFYFALYLTTGKEIPDIPTAAQVAVACALVDVAGYQECQIIASFTREGQSIQTPDQEQALTTHIEAARARLTAMAPEARQVWLAANWKNLVRGSLGLEGVA